MVLEKSVNLEVKKMPVEKTIGITGLRYVGKYGIVNGEEVVDPRGELHVGDKAVIGIVVENFTPRIVVISLKIYDNGKLVPMSESLNQISIMYQPPPIERQISVPCTSVGNHVITAKISIA